MEEPLFRIGKQARKTMGTIHVGCKLENVVDRSKSATLSKILVDSGSEYTWVTESVLERLGIPRE
jgi:hypothetical protein